VFCDTENKIYRKIVFNDDKIVGFIALGIIGDSGIINSYIGNETEAVPLRVIPPWRPYNVRDILYKYPINLRV
jgi:NAD(P)H-nitrite reductase large subunit